MGYVSEIVQSGVALADRVQVSQIVDKVRGYERLDGIIEAASQRGPAVVKTLDQALDQVLGGVSGRKDMALERVNGAVEFVQQKKGDVLERCNTAKDLLEQKTGDVLERCNGAKELLVEKKSVVLERCNGAKDGAKELLGYVHQDALGHCNRAVEFVQQKKGDALERVQKNKDEMLEFVQSKKGDAQSLAQHHLPVAAQERLSQFHIQVGLLVTLLAAQCRSILELPRQCSASLEAAKSWVTERRQQLPELSVGVETVKAWAKTVASDPKEQASKLREMAQARYAAAKLQAASFLTQLPAYRERASAAARDAVAWVKGSATKQD